MIRKPRTQSLAPPAGLVYRAEFISEEEAAELFARIETLQFSEVRMRGVVAKRMVAHFGWNYGYESWQIEPAEAIPDFMQPLRARCAAEAGIPADEFVQLLIARYPEGAGIGWHRDAPMFGPAVAGISLAAACAMRFRRSVKGEWQTYSLRLEPRSLYLLTGAARAGWQHSTPPAKALRYSLTFRQVRESWQSRLG